MTNIPCVQGVLWVICSYVFLLVAPIASAVEPDEILEDPKLEERARTLSLELRCLVCQNQSIDDSDAPLARDLRLLVRERLQKGDTDQQVLDFVVQRYGEFVLLRPPLGAHTFLLWIAPLLILALAIWLARGIVTRRSAPPAESAQGEAALSQEEQDRLSQILGKKSPK